jgi:hypothetical protein
VLSYCYIKVSLGGSKERNYFPSTKLLESMSSSLKNPFQNKSKFSSGRIGCRERLQGACILDWLCMCPGFWRRTAAQDQKKSTMLRISEASSATTIHYGLCISLVLSGKPRLGTAMGWNLGTGRSGKGRGAAKEKLRHELVSKGLGHGLWVKCTTSREC